MKLDTSYYKEYTLDDIKLFIRNANNSSNNPERSETFRKNHKEKVNKLFRHYKKRGGKLSLNQIIKGGR